MKAIGPAGWAAVFGSLAFSFPSSAQEANLAPTPPMGWNSWNHFAERIDDKTVRAQADAMVASGLKDAGYVYINIDDTWEGQRDAKGWIQPNQKFPNMKALADYVHSQGLKLGIYSSPAAKTCAGYEGSLGHEAQDAETYAEWGIDYLKYDWCQPTGSLEDLKAAYAKMREALNKTGRPMVLALCEYGWHKVWEWGAGVGAETSGGPPATSAINTAPWPRSGSIKTGWRNLLAPGTGMIRTCSKSETAE